MANAGIDLYVLYKIVKDIGTPYNEFDAYKVGLIDEKGKRIKKASTPEEKKAMSFYNRFVLNIKRALSRVGLDGRMATYAGALFLLREYSADRMPTEDEIIVGLNEELKYLDENTLKTFNEFFNEEAPAMSTGAAVAGTGDDPVHWKSKGRPRVRGKAIDATAYIKRMNKQRVANNGISTSS